METFRFIQKRHELPISRMQEQQQQKKPTYFREEKGKSTDLVSSFDVPT